MRNGAFIPAVEAQRRNARVSYVKRDWQDECRREDVYFMRSFIVVNSLGLSKFGLVRHVVREFIMSKYNASPLCHCVTSPLTGATLPALTGEIAESPAGCSVTQPEIIELACDNYEQI